MANPSIAKSSVFALAVTFIACTVKPDWVAYYNGPGEGSDYVRSITLDNDELLVIAQASIQSTDVRAKHDVVLLRYDLDGNLISERFSDIGEDVFVFKGFVNNNSAYVIGSADQEEYLVKIDEPSNEILWQQRSAGPFRDIDFHNSSVLSTGGQTAKYDEDGDLVWLVSHDETFPWPYGGEATKLRAGQKIVVDDLGVSFVGGYEYEVEDGEAHRNFWLASYDQDGQLLWQDTWGGSGNDQVTALAIDSQGGVCVTGQYQDSQVVGAYLTRRYDANGQLLWSKQVRTSFSARPTDLTVDLDDNCIVTGVNVRENRGGQRLTVSYDQNGSEAWRVFEDNFQEYTLAAYSHRVISDSKGQIIVSGQHLTTVFDRDGRKLLEAEDETSSVNEMALDEERGYLFIATEKSRGNYDLQISRFSAPNGQ